MSSERDFEKHEFEAVGDSFPDTCRLCACFRWSANHSNVEYPSPEQQVRQLIKAGWTRKRKGVYWTDPYGGTWLGPHQAWCEMKAQKSKAIGLHRAVAELYKESIKKQRPRGFYFVREASGWFVGFWDGESWRDNFQRFQDDAYLEIGPRAGCMDHSDVPTNEECPRCGQVVLRARIEGSGVCSEGVGQ